MASMPVAFRARAGRCRPCCLRHALDGGGRLQAVDEVRRALRVAGRGEDRTVVCLEHVQPDAADSLSHRTMLQVHPSGAAGVLENGVTTLWWLPNDEAHVADVAELLLGHGADPIVRAKDGTTAAEAARLHGLDDAADLLAAAVASRGVVDG